MKLILIITLIGHSFFLSHMGFADRGFAMRAIAHANTAFMAAPPAPSFANKKGGLDLTLRPAQFDAEASNSDNDYSSEGKYDGVAGALLLSYFTTESSGFFLMGMGNSIEGNFSSSIPEQSLDITVTGAKGTFLQVGAGYFKTFAAKSFFPIQIFAGPSVTKTDLEQRVQSSQGDDFIMTASASSLNYIYGVNIGIRLSKHIVFSPYFIASDYFSDDDKCQEFESQVSSFGPLWDMSDQNCYTGDDSSRSQMEYDVSFSAVGLNLMLPSLGLSVNLYNDIGELFGFENLEFNMQYVSLTF